MTLPYDSGTWSDFVEAWGRRGLAADAGKVASEVVKIKKAATVLDSLENFTRQKPILHKLKIGEKGRMYPIRDKFTKAEWRRYSKKEHWIKGEKTSQLTSRAFLRTQ